MHQCRPRSTASWSVGHPTVVCGTCAASPMWRRAAGAARRAGREVTVPRLGDTLHGSPASCAHQPDVTRHGTCADYECTGAANRATRAACCKHMWKGHALPRSDTLLRHTPLPYAPLPCPTALPGTTQAARGVLTVTKAAPWEAGGTGRPGPGAQRAQQPQTQPSGTGVPQLGSRAEFTGSVTSVTYYTVVRCAAFSCAPSRFRQSCSTLTLCFLVLLWLARSPSLASSRWTCRNRGSVCGARR